MYIDFYLVVTEFYELVVHEIILYSYIFFSPIF